MIKRDCSQNNTKIIKSSECLGGKIEPIVVQHKVCCRSVYDTRVRVC